MVVVARGRMGIGMRFFNVWILLIGIFSIMGCRAGVQSGTQQINAEIGRIKEVQVLANELLLVEGDVQDTFGIPFSIIGETDGIEFTRWQTVNLNGDMGHAVLGTVRNTDSTQRLSDLFLQIDWYDSDGHLLNTKKTLQLAPNSDGLAPGAEVDFELWGGVNLQPNDFDHYTVKVIPTWITNHIPQTVSNDDVVYQVSPSGIVSLESPIVDNNGIPFALNGNTEGIEILEFNAVDLSGAAGYTIRGIIRNTNDRYLEGFGIGYELRDVWGDYLQHGGRTISLPHDQGLAPEEDTGFEIEFGFQPKDIARYELEFELHWEER